MKKVSVYDKNLKEVKTLELNDNVFDIKANHNLIHQVSVSLLSNLRRPTAHTKTKSEVSGGGKKPWKQKGTGKARAGSTRSPIWVGGGITFGPRNNRNYQKKINEKMKRKAFCMLLSNKLENGSLIVLENLSFDKPKTKEVIELMNKAKISSKSTLFLLDTNNENTLKAIRNIEKTKVSTNANVLDLLKYSNVVATENVIKKFEELYTKLDFKNK